MTITPSHPVRSDLDEALILVVGARRSGTHWLQRILSSHPDITALPGETHFFSAAIAPLFERFMHGTPASPTVGQLYTERSTLVTAVRHFCDALLLPHLPDGAGNRLLERTPEHVQHIELIASLYPQARFVHIIRDGHDAIRSLLHQSFGPDDVRGAATEWRDSVRAGQEQGQRVSHYVEVRYEALRDDTRGEIARILDWLGLSSNEQVLDDAVRESQVRRNRPRGRPRSMPKKELRILHDVAGDTLAALGYADRQRVGDDAPAKSSRTTEPSHKQPVETPHQRQHVIDQFLSELRSPSPRVERLRSLTSATARFEVVANDGSSTWVDGPQEFVDLLASDNALRAEILQARLHMDARLSVIVHQTDRAVRVFAIRFDDEGIRECSVQQLAG